MNLERALATEGFMAQTELEYLAHLAERHALIVEIGSWQGRSARVFGDNTRGTVWCVDTWADNAYGSAPAEMTCRPDWLWDAFGRNCADLIGSKVFPVRQKSVDAGMAFAAIGASFDLIFIDAGHNYEDVRDDIFVWLPLLKPGGVICGHDYASYHPGVIQAVDQLIPSRRVVEGTTIWTTEPA